MSRYRVFVVLQAVVAVLCAGLVAGAGVAVAGVRQPGGAATVGGTWGKAIEVRGLLALSSVSCASAGNCVVGGYANSAGGFQAFVASERSGTWGKAIEVPGSGGLNKGGDARVTSVSCASAGNCSAGGEYLDRSLSDRGFVVTERSGIWGKAIEVPGTNRAGGSADVSSVSCASAGNCVAGGTYQSGPGGGFQAIVARERNGTWGKAIEVPGSGALNKGGDAQVTSVSCASAGNCAVGGEYGQSRSNFRFQAFVASERNGTWGKAIEVPGSGALNKGGGAEVNSVSCASAGNCAAGGVYLDSSDNDHGFVVSKSHGTWGRAIEVPGRLNRGRAGSVSSVSCPSAGNCAAAGDYAGKSGFQAFVVNERKGVWGGAIEVPGSGALNKGGDGGATSVSCASAGNCAAGGTYAQASQRNQAFVVNESKGVWGRAIEVPGSGALNKGGDAGVTSVSCVPTGSCAAGGRYADASRNPHPFVDSRA